MFQNIYEVKISGKDVKRFVKKLYKSNIFIEELYFSNRCVYLKLDKQNYERLKEIKTIYKIELVRMYGVVKIINIIKTHSFLVFGFIVSIIYLIFLSKVIFEVEVIHSDKKIRDLLYNELQEYNIKKYSFVKSYESKEQIKNKILEKYKDKLEWLEINRIGTRYEIRVEERIINKEKKKEKPNHIIAKKDGIIKKITSTKGEIVKKVDDYVKKGDILVSGLITKNDTIKNKVSAKANVYAEVWYKTNINMPFYYREEKVTKNSKKTLKIRFINKDLYFLNFDKYETYKENKIISFKNNLLPIEVIFAEEKETNVIEELFSKEEAIEEAKRRTDHKLKSNLLKDEKILKSKILDIHEYENYINVVIFYKVYENISIEKEITDEDVKQYEENSSN